MEPEESPSLTTQPLPPSEETELFEVLDLIEILPWMKSLLSANDTTIINLEGVSYHIGNSDIEVEHKNCSVHDLGKSGHCTLIFNCPSVYPELTDANKYKDYFCSLNSDK